MTDSSLMHRILSGKAGGWAAPLRGLLRALSAPYASVVESRNRRYDRRGPSLSFPIPVISVGNITAGGTGKTPLVIDIVQRLDSLGCSPTVVSRGYGAAAGQPNDEELVIRRNCPSAVCVADANRAAGIQLAVDRFGADVVVLDDGFQHRRVRRDLDIVTIDATCPFGYGHVLPRGLLRESPRNLHRAQLIVVTRTDMISRSEHEYLMTRLEEFAPDRPVIRCRHRVTSFEFLDGHPCESPPSKTRALLFAGIGNPHAFESTVRSLGISIVDSCWFPDHHRYRAKDLDRVRASARGEYDVIITTEKDAAKLCRLPGIDGSRVRVMRIAIDFVGDGSTMLQSMLEDAIRKRRSASVDA
ncbi:MAG: tetraacyldisaccharide 4'-kinase [Phycisphaerae bacterium]|nr:tetraacyldisaccharide 4'-kinase [Phycisphaerae bacterium]